MNPIDYLRLGVEQYLRELPDDEFDELMQLVRPPDAQRPRNEQTAFLKSLLGGRGD
ncbi:hypothetical protein JF710_11850 [Mycobacterium intracellulare]|uniref:hypothetical protein n=1 Tax=Mycobacterium intracellulare TaxID=1767 RepID=UPI001CDAFEBF|nr:hypothetical protein [Mycobacterium intracellulare]MCA2253863.1 hypothetical protein [Mycobacterium intracellulare]